MIGHVSDGVAARRDDRSPDREIERAFRLSGWQLARIVHDRDDGRILERPALSRALEQITEGQARALVVNDARFLSHSVDFAMFVQRFRDLTLHSSRSTARSTLRRRRVRAWPAR